MVMTKSPPQRIEKLRRRPCKDDGAKLDRDFYARPVLVVARECIGKVLVHRTNDGEAAGRIVEAEAYRGPLDRAAHSARGLTKRTAAMFGPPGYAYVYLIYGISWALNLVVATEGEPHAVLIRALEPVRGLELMAGRRSQARRVTRANQWPRQVDPGFGDHRRGLWTRLVRRGVVSGRRGPATRQDRPLGADQRRLRRDLGGKIMALLRAGEPLCVGAAARLRVKGLKASCVPNATAGAVVVARQPGKRYG